MTIDSLKRIMWRLREKNDTKRYALTEVECAIYNEIGLDARTVKKYIKILKKMKQLKRINRYEFMDMGDLL